MDGHPEDILELLVPGRRRLAVPGLVVHEGPMDPCDITTVDGIRTTNVARTLCDGSVEPAAAVEEAVEWAWRSGWSLTWIERTARRLHRPGQRGTKVVLDLLAGAAPRARPTASQLDLRVERALRDVPGLVRQHVVRDRQSRFVARVDFAVPRRRVAVEAHSRRFHSGRRAETADVQRESALHAEGWIVRYVTDAEARHPVESRRSVLGDRAGGGQYAATRSTTKIRSVSGGTPNSSLPVVPKASSYGTVIWRRPPSRMPSRPWTSPGRVWPSA